MRKYEIIMIMAVGLWCLLINMDQRKISELKRCKISFLGFAVASLGILFSPNYLVRIPEMMVFFGALWYGARIFTKDIIEFIKIVINNILAKENADE